MNKFITTSKGIFAFVEIPSDATEVQTWNHRIGFKSEILKTDKDSNGFQHLCTGLFRWRNWEVISTTNTITEKQIESIVEKYTNYETERERLLDEMYEDYLQKGNYWMQDSSGIKLWAFKTAKESLQSLIQANNLDITKNYVIIKKP